jgi:hypothetical protein
LRWAVAALSNRCKRELGGRGRYRSIEHEAEDHVLREGAESCGSDPAGAIVTLRRKSG